MRYTREPGLNISDVVAWMGEDAVVEISTLYLGRPLG